MIWIASLTQAVVILEGICKVVGNLLLAASYAIPLALLITIARSRGFTGKRIFTIVLLSLVFVFFAFMSYKVGASYNEFFEYIDTQMFNSDQSLANHLAKATTIEKRSKLSHLQAEHRYVNDGKIGKYRGMDGTEKRYEPSPEAIKNRDFILLGQAFRAMQDKITVANIIIWIFIPLIAFGIGFARTIDVRSNV